MSILPSFCVSISTLLKITRKIITVSNISLDNFDDNKKTIYISLWYVFLLNKSITIVQYEEYIMLMLLKQCNRTQIVVLVLN